MRVNEQLEEMMRPLTEPWELAEKIHMVPHHHGNRSPFADPEARGIIDGESMDVSESALPRIYLAAIQALAYATRHIVDVLRAHGLTVSSVSACGGSAKSQIYLQEHADALQVPITLPEEPESVLLGAATLAAVAAGKYDSVAAACKAMCRSGDVIVPRAAAAGYHAWKAQEQLRLYDEHLLRRARVLSRHFHADAVASEETANVVYFTADSPLCLRCAMAPGGVCKGGGGGGGAGVVRGLQIGRHCFGTVWDALGAICR
jgi:ribulose kinase